MGLRQIRKSLGYTQVEVAKGIGVSQGCINMYEHNYREMSHNTMRKLAKFLNVEPWQLLPEDMQPKILQPIIEEKEMAKSKLLSTLLTPFRFIGYGIRNSLAFILRNCFNCMVIYPKKKGKKNAK